MTEVKTHRQHRLDSVLNSIERICGAWNDALEAEASIGYPSGGQSLGSGTTDSTGEKAVNLAKYGDPAAQWMHKSRCALGVLLYYAAADGEGRWTGAFYPPKLRSVFMRAAKDWDALRPRNMDRLFVRIIDLGNEAANRWPATPTKGKKVGDVVVGLRSTTGEDCAGCGRYVAGGIADPIVRLDGKPYHRQPCYNTAYQRKRRSRFTA